jgi:hypothetical protein
VTTMPREPVAGRFSQANSAICGGRERTFMVETFREGTGRG